MAQKDIKARGLRSCMVWIPEGLHRAVKIKLAQEKLTIRDVIIWFLTRWTGYQGEDVIEQNSGSDKEQNGSGSDS